MIILGLCSRASARTSSKSISSESAPHAVRDRVVELPGKTDFRAVGEMAAVRQRHSQHGVAGLEVRHEHRHVRLRARVRLNVGVVGSKKALEAIDREQLGQVDELAAAVVALSGIAFGVLVGHHAAHRFAHRAAGVVLRSDQLEIVFLAALLAGDRGKDFRIVGFDMAGRQDIHSVTRFTALAADLSACRASVTAPAARRSFSVRSR